MARRWGNHCILLAACLGLSVSTVPASAQDAENKGLENKGLELVELTGTLEAITRDAIKIKTADNQEKLAVILPQTTFEYTGTADARFLMPGLLVRFTAPFDQAGTQQGPVSELEVFRPTKSRKMSREQVLNQTPGIHPAAEAKEGKAKDGKSKAPPIPAGAQNFQVVGQLRAVQADKLQVVAGPRPLIVQVDPSAKITVSAGDTYFFVPGDEVTISGLKDSTGAIRAEEIKVEGAKPLGAMEQKPGARGSRANTRGKLGDKQDK